MSVEVAEPEIPKAALEAEAAALGAALIETAAARWIVDHLKPCVYYRAVHRFVDEAIRRVLEKRQAVDPVLVAEDLRAAGKLGEVGGPEYLHELTQRVATADHVAHYGNLVLRAYYDRELARAALELPQTDPPGEVLERIARICRARDLTEARGAVSMADACHEVIDKLERGATDLWMLGIPELDSVSRGHEPGDLITIGARTRVGKTGLLLAIATRMAEAGRRIAFYPGEMAPYQVARRAIAARASVEHWRIRAGQVPPDKWLAVTQAAAWLAELPLFFCPIPSPSLRDIAAFADAVRAEVTVIDYLTRCTLPKAESMRIRVHEFMKGLKNHGRETGRLQILAAQISRQIDKQDKPPTLSDLRESGAIEDESDGVCLLHATIDQIEGAEPNIDIQAAWAKGRGFAARATTIRFEREYQRISSPVSGPEQEEMGL